MYVFKSVVDSRQDRWEFKIPIPDPRMICRSFVTELYFVSFFMFCSRISSSLNHEACNRVDRAVWRVHVLEHDPTYPRDRRIVVVHVEVAEE